MKKSLLIVVGLLSILPTYIFGICIQGSGECNDTIDSKKIQEDLIIKALIESGEIIATKQEVENFGLEQIKAYYRSLGNGITTQESVKDANLGGNITRAEMAKMVSNYAKNILNKTVDESTKCEFSDTELVKGDLATAIIEVCQLGIMGQGIREFRPNDSVTRAEFGTVLSRTLWGDKNEGGERYYENHLKALKEEGIMNKIDTPSNKEIRGYVMLMLMRSSDPNYIQSYDDENYIEYDDISYVMEMLD